MKKIVLNINDTIYEKLKFEAMLEKKSIPHLVSDRVFYKPFAPEVEEAFESWLESEISKIMES